MNTCSTYILLTGIILLSFFSCDCWRAIPANQAMYALRDATMNLRPNEEGKLTLPDDLLPRDQLNNIYKFGWCRPDVITHQFLRKTVNLTLPTWQDTQTQYIYLIEHANTRRYELQCVVMKTYVNRKFMFLKSRLPLYYCQGLVYYLMMNTVNRLAIHEFYIYYKLSVPLNFVFEFYHPPHSGF